MSTDASVEPIFDPGYWRTRLAHSRGELHRAIFNGSIDQFKPLEDIHRSRLQREVKPHDFILDAGCGYGRLAGLMPCHWEGAYMGVDQCPEFLEIAKLIYPLGKFSFHKLDLRELPFSDKIFHLAVVCSVKPMVIRNAGAEEWAKMETEINRVSERVLYLDYGAFEP